ncbi:hypothetical protein Tco_0386053 [Tanacetum coccineum]
MSSPKFAETHNVVAFLEKPKESDGFAEIIDFLKASSVSYALTVNPVIYTSCIEQFWATAKVQTVNGVRQLQALVDKKRVIVTESSIRRDLHLDDAEGTDCLPTATIFEELARMGYEKPSQKLAFYKAFFSAQWKHFIHNITQCLSAKSTAWNEFGSSMASLIIYLATNQKFNLSKYIFDAMVKHLDGGVKFLLYPQEDPEVRKRKCLTYRFKKQSGMLEDDEMPVEAKVDGKDKHSTKPDDSTGGKHVYYAATSTNTRPRIKWVVVPEPSECRVPQEDPKQTSMFLKIKEKKEAKLAREKKKSQLFIGLTMGFEIKESKEKKEEDREEITKRSRKKMLGRKRAGKEQQKESSKKQKDEDIAIDAIPLATKLPVITDYKIHKENREDLEALWRIVKAKYGDTRPDNEFERVLWGDLKVMFKPDKRSDVWRILQGYRVTIWKLIDSSGVHFVRNRSRFGINKWYQSFALRNFDLEDMELESTNSGLNAKLSILKLGEYEMWAIILGAWFESTTWSEAGVAACGCIRLMNGLKAFSNQGNLFMVLSSPQDSGTNSLMCIWSAMGLAATAMIAAFTSRSFAPICKESIVEVGSARKILCMEIVRDRGSRTLKVSQSGYDQKILNNYRVNNGKSVSVPLGAHFKHVVALSTTEAEYMKLTEAVKDCILLIGRLIER